MANEKLKESLRKVNLVHSSRVVDEYLSRAAHKELSYTDFLQELLSDEIEHRRQSRIKERLRRSQLKVKKTLDSFDFKHPKRINGQLIRSLFRLDFIKEKKNIILISPPGLGKTHIASAIVYQACLNDYKCSFTTAMNLINELNASLSDNTFLKCMKRFINYDLLVIDELGYLPVDKQGAGLLFQIISNRYESGSVIITSNRPFKEWGKIFNGDDILASAAIDRLIHHSEIIKIEGESYRVRNKK